MSAGGDHERSENSLAQPDLPFESAWSNLEAECAAAGVEIVDSDAVRAYLRIHPDTIAVTGQICARQPVENSASRRR